MTSPDGAPPSPPPPSPPPPTAVGRWRITTIALLGVFLVVGCAVVVGFVGIWLTPMWEPGDPGPPGDPHGYARLATILFGAPLIGVVALLAWGIVALVRRRASGYVPAMVVGGITLALALQATVSVTAMSRHLPDQPWAGDAIPSLVWPYVALAVLGGATLLSGVLGHRASRP